MLTVKSISMSGIEFVLEALDVRFEPRGLSNGTGPDAASPARLFITQRDGSDYQMQSGGTVFVMNEHGKTVARYDLGASPVPLVGDGLSDPRPRGIGERYPVGDQRGIGERQAA